MNDADVLFAAFPDLALLKFHAWRIYRCLMMPGLWMIVNGCPPERIHPPA
jgi:hypothetical protein